MKHDDLLEKCITFEKLANTPNSNTDLSNRLREVLRRVSALLPSQYQAEQAFKSIQDSKQKNQLEFNPFYKEAQKLLLQLEFLEQRAPQAAASMGVKANAIPTIKQNLKTLLEGNNFAGYQHYTLVPYGQAVPIDLDEWEQQQRLKKDLGF